MPFCEIITKFSFGKHKQLRQLITENSVLFTNDPIILEQISRTGYDIKLINNYFGLYNEKINKINEEAIHKFNHIKKDADDKETKYNVHDSLKYFHLQRLIFLEIVHEILKEGRNVVFIFGNLLFHYFSIMEIAKSLGFKTKYGISRFTNDRIKQVAFDETRMTKLLKIEQELGEIKLHSNFEYTDSYDTRIEDIKINETDPKYAFFLINNATDFYLKPVYPILKKFQDERTEFSIFTFDMLTYTQLSQKGFKPNDLTEYLDELSIKPHKIIRDINKNSPLSISPKPNKEKIENYEREFSSGEDTLPMFGQSRIDKKRIIHLLKRKIGWNRKIHLLKRKYLRRKRRIVNVYFNHLQYVGIIRWIVSRELIKPRLMRFAGLVEDEFSIDIPEREIKQIQNIVRKVVSIPTDDIVLRAYLSYFKNDNIVNYIANNIAVYTILNLLFKKFKFSSIFVAMDGSPANNTVCTIAKKYNIPTYSLPQIFIRINKIQVALPSASNIFISGEKVKKELVKLGADENKLIVTGNPRYDFLKQNKRENAGFKVFLDRIFKKNLQFSGDLIIVAMSRWHKNDHIWMSKLIYFCNQQNLDILIKIHPMYKSPINYNTSKEKVNKIRNMCKDLRFTISYDINLSNLWSQTKVLITEQSIVAIEAALSTIPIVIADIDKDGKFEGLEYQKEGIALHATSIEELHYCIEKILYDEKTKKELEGSIKKFCYEYNYLNDGSSTERIYRILTNKNERIKLDII